MNEKTKINMEVATVEYENATEGVRRSYGEHVGAFFKTLDHEQAVQWAMIGIDIKGLIDTAMSVFYMAGMRDMLEFIEQEETA